MQWDAFQRMRVKAGVPGTALGFEGLLLSIRLCLVPESQGSQASSST